jgi:hypothetical protein
MSRADALSHLRAVAQNRTQKQIPSGLSQRIEAVQGQFAPNQQMNNSGFVDGGNLG